MIEWCAEIGSNHKGILSLAEEMVYQAKRAGATIAKFQLGRDPNDPIRCMDHWAHEIVDFCDMMNVEFMASVWSERGLEIAQEVGMRRYKIAHQQTNGDVDMAYEILLVGKPCIISTCRLPDPFFADLSPLGAASAVWLYVSPDYPANTIRVPRAFGGPGWFSGYSHHGRGIGAPLLAVARGAKYIECHFTLDKTEESIKDNHFALSPAEFKQMVEVGTEIGRYV